MKLITRTRHKRPPVAYALLVTASVFIPTPIRSEEVASHSLRVCADPNNLPFSNHEQAGFENKIARIVAEHLGLEVNYTWWAQRRGYIRNTLKQELCDVLMGVPVGLEMVATTRPYYRSRYVFVSRADRGYRLTSIKDPRLKAMTIGVQLIGNDGYNTPPAHALSEQGIITNLVGYTVYGDYRQPNPPARIVEAVAGGAIDIAAVWGPLAGYFAKRSPVPVVLAPITDTAEFAPLRFEFDIAAGVRKNDEALRMRIDAALADRHVEIVRVLASYGVPLVTPEAGIHHSSQ